MKKIIFTILVLITLLTSCSSPTKPNEEPRPVKVMVITDDFKHIERNYPGSVGAGEKVSLSFKVSGQLNQLLVKEGERVKQEQMIASIDPKDFEISASEAKAKYDLAKITYERYAQLVQTDAVSKAAYDEKKYTYEFLKSQYEQALKSLADTKLYAPFTGIVAKRLVENYQQIQAGQPIISLQNFSELEIIINVPEQDVFKASNIKKQDGSNGKKIIGYVNFPTSPKQKFPVFVKEMSTVANPQTQTYQVILSMPAPSGLIILPGMTANVAIDFSIENDNHYYIPTSAVLADPKGTMFIWMVDVKQLTVMQQAVKTGQVVNDRIQILSGLKNGDTIVIAGGNYLYAGMKVKLIVNRIGY